MGVYTIERGYRIGRRWPLFIAASILLLTVSYLLIGGPKTKQLPAKTATRAFSQPASTTPPASQLRITTPLPWPNYGQAAYGVIDDGVLARSNERPEQVPIASLAKTITALAILKQKPLKLGEQGPLITITGADEAIYRDYVAKSGTVVQVKAGVQISEYQALEAMLMPSANNIADMLANWTFGSVSEYSTYANNMLKKLGITQTTVADASGYSPLTKSTAADMVKIGILYMQNPILRGIAQTPQANIPFTGMVYNYNATHNEDGIMGIKIGYTEEAGKTYLAADVKAHNQNEISVAAVLGAGNMTTAMQDAERLLISGNIGHAKLPKSQP